MSSALNLVGAATPKSSTDLNIGSIAALGAIGGLTAHIFEICTFSAGALFAIIDLLVFNELKSDKFGPAGRFLISSFCAFVITKAFFHITLPGALLLNLAMIPVALAVGAVSKAILNS